jgi:tetratricopeptide (TPR) repeat protein
LAETCYSRARALDPGSYRWPYYLGNVQAWIGKQTQAIANLREAAQRNRSYAPARLRLAQLLFESGETAEAERLFRELASQNPRRAKAQLGLGRALAARGDWKEAIEAFRRACALFENFAEAEYALGMAYRKTGELDKAREHLQRSQRARSERQPSEDPLMDQVKALYAGGLTRFAKASSLAEQGKAGEAAAEFEAALQENPRLVMAHINLIAMYGQLNLPEQAERHYRAALEKDSGWVEIHYNWGLFLLRRGQTAEAAAAFEKAVAMNPLYPDARIQMGLLSAAQSRREDAIRHYRRALEGNPRHRQARYLLGRELLLAGNAVEAVEHLLETVRVEDERTPVCLQALAAAYARSGDRQQAAAALERARVLAAKFRMSELASQLQQELARLAPADARP